MAMQDVKDGRLLYHLTKLSNLESIIEKGLASRKLVKTHNVDFDDVADQRIITKRTELGLDEYVPFHFHPYSSFDKAVKSTYVNENFIYITLKRTDARRNNFKVLPRHPLSGETEAYLLEYDEGMDAIDWEAMHTLGTEDDYIKNVKMAECLTDLVIPVSSFTSICVKDEETKKVVENILKENGIEVPPPYVNIQKWFD